MVGYKKKSETYPQFLRRGFFSDFLGLLQIQADNHELVFRNDFQAAGFSVSRVFHKGGVALCLAYQKFH